MLYVSETDSPIEAFNRTHGIATPPVHSGAALRVYARSSRYRVERAFNSWDKSQKRWFLNMAAGTGADGQPLFARWQLLDMDKHPHTTGWELAHYTEDGQRKIARIFRYLRRLTAHFPVGITEREFTLIEKTKQDIQS